MMHCGILGKSLALSVVPIVGMARGFREHAPQLLGLLNSEMMLVLAPESVLQMCLGLTTFCQAQVQVQVPGQVQKVQGLRTKDLDLG